MVSEKVKTMGCDHCHCNDASSSLEMYNISSEERKLWKVEELGTESPYRCITCRNCTQCKKGDTLEAISLKEEAEQAQIELSVELDPANNTLWAKLPFVVDPVVALKPNRFVAERVLKSQMALFEKRPGMREDAVKSHQKLRYWTRAMLWHTEISGGGEGGGWIYG
jgi:hypothetical protein